MFILTSSIGSIQYSFNMHDLIRQDNTDMASVTHTHTHTHTHTRTHIVFGHMNKRRRPMDIFHGTNLKMTSNQKGTSPAISI